MTTTASLPWLAPRDAAARSRAVGACLVIAVLVAAALFGRLCYLAKPFDQDARLFIYFGKLFCEGGWYGHDVTDNKFPTVGMATSVFWRAFGLHWAAYVIVQTSMALGGAMLLGRIARRHVDPSAALPTALFAVALLNFSVVVFGGFQLETMQVFFAILAAGAALEGLRSQDWRDAFTVGLAAGVAMMFKPNGGAVLGAFALVGLIRWARQPRTLLKQGGAAAVGLAIPLAVVLVYLVRSNTLAVMPELYHQIALYAKSMPLTLGDWLKPVAILAMVGFPVFVRGWVHRRERIPLAVPIDRAVVTFVATWFVIELAGVIAHRHMTGNHFLVILPAAALLYGLVPRRPRLTPLVAGLAPVVLLSVLGGMRVIRESPSEYFARQPVSDYLLAHTAPGDAIWQDCMAQTLMETNLRPGSRIPLTFLFLNSDEAPLEYSAVMLRDFAYRKPKYILLPRDLDGYLGEKARRIEDRPGMQKRFTNYCAGWRSIFNYVQTRYAPEIDINGETLYRRRDESSR